MGEVKYKRSNAINDRRRFKVAMRRNATANVDAMPFLICLPPSSYSLPLHSLLQFYSLLRFHAGYMKRPHQTSVEETWFQRLNCK